MRSVSLVDNRGVALDQNAVCIRYPITCFLGSLFASDGKFVESSSNKSRIFMDKMKQRTSAVYRVPSSAIT